MVDWLFHPLLYTHQYTSVLLMPTVKEKCFRGSLQINFHKFIYNNYVSRQEELEYLGFISGITQDILSRRCLSDAALELLIGCHIERNLHKLDKVLFFPLI